MGPLVPWPKGAEGALGPLALFPQGPIRGAEGALGPLALGLWTHWRRAASLGVQPNLLEAWEPMGPLLA